VSLGLVSIAPVATLITLPREFDQCGDERQFGFKKMPFDLGTLLAYFCRFLMGVYKPHRAPLMGEQD
jgi:hypothetical protein